MDVIPGSAQTGPAVFCFARIHVRKSDAGFTKTGSGNVLLSDISGVQRICSAIKMTWKLSAGRQAELSSFMLSVFQQVALGGKGLNCTDYLSLLFSYCYTYCMLLLYLKTIQTSCM